MIPISTLFKENKVLIRRSKKSKKNKDICNTIYTKTEKPKKKTLRKNFTKESIVIRRKK